MDLNTRCPYCETVFPASLEQLQLRKGFIRCVQCAHIFDGYEHVVASDALPTRSSEPSIRVDRAAGATRPVLQQVPREPRVAVSREPRIPVPAEPTVSSAPEPVVPVPAEPRIPAGPVTRTGPSIQAEPHLSELPSVVRGRREFTISDLADIESGPEPFVREAADLPPGDDDIPAAAASDPLVASPVARHDGPDLAGSLRPERQWWRPLIAVVWLLLIALAGLALVAQLVYVFRVQIAANVPALRPALERMCVSLDCTVAWSRQIEHIVITRSSLHQEAAGEDDDQVDSVVLELTMRNAHDRPQEWPTLVLELKDFAGATVARKHLPASVYLPAGRQDTPFPAGTEYDIRLPLTLHGLKVNGYQLTAFFP